MSHERTLAPPPIIDTRSTGPGVTARPTEALLAVPRRRKRATAKPGPNAPSTGEGDDNDHNDDDDDEPTPKRRCYDVLAVGLLHPSSHTHGICSAAPAAHYQPAGSPADLLPHLFDVGCDHNAADAPMPPTFVADSVSSCPAQGLSLPPHLATLLRASALDSNDTADDPDAPVATPGIDAAVADLLTWCWCSTSDVVPLATHIPACIHLAQCVVKYARASLPLPTASAVTTAPPTQPTDPPLAVARPWLNAHQATILATVVAPWVTHGVLELIADLVTADALGRSSLLPREAVMDPALASTPALSKANCVYFF